MKRTTIEWCYSCYDVGGWYLTSRLANGIGLCREELERVFPHINWSDHTQVIDVMVSRRRDTGFKTIRLGRDADGSLAFCYGRGAKNKLMERPGQLGYIPPSAARWLTRNGFKAGETIYVRMTGNSSRRRREWRRARDVDN